jgi:hypothetical protein
MPIANYNRTKTKYREVATEASESVQKLAREYFGDQKNINITGINNFMVEASRNDQWLEDFNNAAKFGAEQKIKKFNEEELKVQYSILAPELSKEEVDNRIATFATTGSDATGSNVAMDPILPTNILDVDQYLFKQDGSILNDVTIIREPNETQIPEFDIAPRADKTHESGSTVPKNVARRDGLDYKLNPDNKLQIVTEINELALKKGTAAYFMALREILVREVENEIAFEIFNGDDTAHRFHGLKQAITPSDARNKRGIFDVTSDSNIAAESNKLRKLVLMLGTLPSNLTKPSEVADYGWYMNRTTYYQGVIASLDGESRYYMEQILSGNPNLIGPHGFPVKLVSNDCLANGQVILAPMKKYYVQMPDGIELRDDGGIVNFNEGKILVKAVTYADGGFSRNFMRTSDWTTGGDNNRDRNAWRYITGI